VPGRGHTVVNVTLTPGGADRKYAGRAVTPVLVTNRDIYWPFGLTVAPELWPLGGMNGTVVGCAPACARRGH
jgi:hypothetical protein